MVKDILLILAVLLAVFGLCEIIHIVKLGLVSVDKNKNLYSLVFLKNNQASQQLDFVIEQHRWHGRWFAETVIAVTSGLQEDEIASLKEKAEKSDIILCPGWAIENVINSLSEFASCK